jgi:putative ribosome biogenesis GTPase RsgA
MMKTFETEKNNIPDGATHYTNETDADYFAWFKGVESGDFAVMVIGTSSWVRGRKSYYINLVKPIPQAKEVEWVSGDKCSYEADNDSHTFIAMTSDSKCCIRYDVANNFFEVCIGEISKPETEVERVERERANAMATMIGEFINTKLDESIAGKVAKVCAALYDAGYRKES